MDLPLTYNFCKTNKIALINEANTSILHTCGSLKPRVLSSIENLLLDKIEKKNHTDDEFESLLTELYTDQSDEYDFSNMDDLDLIDIANAISPSDDLLDDKNKGPIIKLINATITKAVYYPHCLSTLNISLSLQLIAKGIHFGNLHVSGCASNCYKRTQVT